MIIYHISRFYRSHLQGCFIITNVGTWRAMSADVCRLLSCACICGHGTPCPYICFFDTLPYTCLNSLLPEEEEVVEEGGGGGGEGDVGGFVSVAG